MEAAARTRLAGDRAQRIVDAMRASVARRGVVRSTFDHVAREAGVSRGLLHYYFGTKEKLLIEVVRRDCEVRLAVLEEQMASVRTADDFIDLLVVSLEDIVQHDPDFVTLVFELFTLSRRNEEIAAEFAELLRRTREHVAAVLTTKAEQGVLKLRAAPDVIAEILFALGDGVALRMLVEGDRDFTTTIRAGAECVRALLADHL